MKALTPPKLEKRNTVKPSMGGSRQFNRWNSGGQTPAKHLMKLRRRLSIEKLFCFGYAAENANSCATTT
jgi:hypothetical protein